MAYYYKNKEVEIFTQPVQWPRYIHYRKAVEENLEMNNRCGFTGSLCYSNHHDFYDPWMLAARHVIEGKKKPLVAANPVYVHPYTLVKSITTLTEFLQGPLAVNFITGTSLNDLRQVGDDLSKEERYQRLDEYMEVVKLYLESNRNPFSFEGKYFHLENTSYVGEINELPDFYIAGSSELAIELIKKYEAVQARPLFSSDLKENKGFEKTAFFVSVHEAENTSQGILQLKEFLQINKASEVGFRFKMANTDSVWRKKQLEDTEFDAADGFWAGSIKSMINAPFLVGKSEIISENLNSILEGGCNRLITPLINAGSYKMLKKALIGAGCEYKEEIVAAGLTN